MNARTIILTITAAALLAAPGSVFAQQGPGNCDGTGPHGRMGGPGGGGGLGGFGGQGGHGLLRMLDRVGDRIGLTDAQRTQIETIVDARKPELNALRDQAQAERATFRDGHEMGDFDEATVRAHFESQASLHVEMQLIGASMMSQAWNVLTPDQQQELQDLMARLGDGRGGPRHGGGKRLGK